MNLFSIKGNVTKLDVLIFDKASVHMGVAWITFAPKTILEIRFMKQKNTHNLQQTITKTRYCRAIEWSTLLNVESKKYPR